MSHYTKIIPISGGAEALAFAGLTQQELTGKVHQLFVQSGYKVCGQDGITTIYEKGSRVMRLLLGAFVKYYKIGASVHTDANGEVIVTVQNRSSGVSGGLLGMRQIKKEHERLVVLLQGL
jgi:hypothetical protein